MSARLVSDKDGKLHYDGIPVDYCQLEWLFYNWGRDACRLWLIEKLPKHEGYTLGYADFPNNMVLVLGEREA